jgi:hypothetical protein
MNSSFTSAFNASEAKVLSVFVEQDCRRKKALMWMWETFARDRQLAFCYSDNNGSEIIIGESDKATVRYNPVFWNKIDKQKYHHSDVLETDGLIHFEDGTADLFSTAFYLINCIQEYAPETGDELGRYTYAASLQKKFGHVTHNFVGDLFARTADTLFPGLTVTRKTHFFFSHDIDTIYGAPLQDAKAAFNQKKWARIPGILFNTKAWQNIPAINELNNSFGVKSTFFWLVNRGRINERASNSDYNIHSPVVRQMINETSQKGAVHGLHKSLSNTSFTEEADKLGIPVFCNRNHFLHFSIPEFWEEFEKSGLKLDTSLGFAEQFGFRNSYALPFYPFDLTVNRARKFLEVPLNLMDATLGRYASVPLAENEEKVIRFFEQNSHNCVLSVLWHNSNFTNYKYKGFPALYERILTYVKNNNLPAVTPVDLLNQFPASGHSSVIFQ